ncbi:ABC transporter ATP-binding protein [Bosea minatitlanensis]|uniref:ABC transporter ATP-binding protein n=1 Tax=Bosea minatitlanensis TaxID=128782 RepID=A0ABW0F270_9HYPH|nr:ABC transporter ATP-binding protein [Bosea minatitlanensis]MCT4495250.1 ABC transporter ATP-binding protein [Bosea minatitlanensis]
MLSVEDIEVRYGGITALHKVSIEVEEGETVLLIGANGAGKSSLINAVIGATQTCGGRIRFKGQDIGGLSADRRARAGIGYSPEGRKVFGTLSVADNVLSGAFGMGRRHQKEAFDWLSSVFPILAERAEQPAGQLSGGQQQIVAFARAMSSYPKLLLLDEPFLGLAPVWIQRISDAIREIQRRGTTILMTEQMARPALKLATRGYIMRGGEVRRSGSVADIGDAALVEEYL